MLNKPIFLVSIDSTIPESILAKVTYCLEALLAEYVSLQIHTQRAASNTATYQLIYASDMPDELGNSSVYIPFKAEDWEKKAIQFWSSDVDFQKVDLIRQVFAFITDEASWDYHSAKSGVAEPVKFGFDHIDSHNRFYPKADALKKLPETVINYFYQTLTDKGILDRSKYGTKKGILLSFDIDNLLVGWKGLAYRFWKGAKVIPFSNWKSEKAIFVQSVNKIIDQLEAHNHKAIFYLKAPLYSHKFDAKDYLSVNSSDVQKLLSRIKNHVLIEVGYHSSYKAANNVTVFTAELKRLEKWLERQIITHRSHYLKLEFPTFYEALKKTSIKFDSSVAWSDMQTSKSGMSVTYPLYDFIGNKKSIVTEIPLTFMDSQLWTLRNTPIEEIQNTLEHQIIELRTHTLLLSWDFHHHIYDSLLNPINAAVFEHALEALSKNSIQTFHSYELC